MIIRVDCYDLDQADIDDFMSRFAEGVASMADYSAENSPHVSKICFEVTHDSIAVRN